MPDSPEDVARRSAARLSGEIGASLPAVVERELQAGDEEQPAKYEPASLIALAGLLVSIASLAWTIYRDLKKETDKPSSEVLGRRVRVSVELPEGVTAEQRDLMIGVVVEEVVEGSGTSS